MESCYQVNIGQPVQSEEEPDNMHLQPDGTMSCLVKPLESQANPTNTGQSG